MGDDEGWIGRVDFADLSLRLLIEVDSELYHGGVSARRADGIRDARCHASGWFVLRLPEAILDNPHEVARRVRQARAEAAAAIEAAESDARATVSTASAGPPSAGEDQG